MEQPAAQPDAQWNSTSGNTQYYDKHPTGRSFLSMMFIMDGRIPRLHYWLGNIGIFIYLQFVLAIQKAIGTSFEVAAGSPPADLRTLVVRLILHLMILVGLVVAIWVILAFGVKRWHDRNRPWTFALLGFVPIVGWLWQFIECGCMEGTLGPNRYGPSPKGITAVVYGDPVGDVFD